MISDLNYESSSGDDEFKCDCGDPKCACCSAGGLDKYLDQLAKDIKKKRWIVQCIIDAEPPYSYSIGLEEGFQHPELICVLSAQFAGKIINNVVEFFIKKGIRLEDGMKLPGVVSNYSLIVKEVPRHLVQEDFGAGLAYAARFKLSPPRYFQLVWPDEENHFPWDKKYNKSKFGFQKVYAQL